MRGVGRCPKLLLGFAASIFIINSYLSSAVFAEDSPQTCFSAVMSIDDPNESSVFTVSVKCSKHLEFFSEHSSETISRITLNNVHPFRVSVFNDASGSIYRLNILFNYSEFEKISLKSRSLNIEPGVIMDGANSLDTPIILNTLQIIDKVSPVAANHDYLIYGTSLIKTSINGILSDVKERESEVTEVIVDAQPLIGHVEVNHDGSFTYTYLDGEFGNDLFKYHVVDSSSNASNIATVNIYDAAPEIEAKFYNSNSPLSRYARLGDKLVLEFSTSEKSFIDEDGIIICGHVIDDYININNINFFASWTVTDSDTEGTCAASIALHDIVGNEALPYQGLDTAPITIDKTNPDISLKRDDIVDVELGQVIDYVSEFSASDANLDKNASTISGYVDFNSVGDYEVTYQASDLAGNVTSVKQLFRVNYRYYDYSNRLLLSGISSNLWQVNAKNYENFSNLYFEKVVDGKKVGRITFLGPIDISNYEDMFLIFLAELPEIFLADNFGEVGMSLGKIEDGFRLMDGGAQITFYNLNEIGYSEGSKQQDVISNLSVYGDDGEDLGDYNILSYGGFSGCNLGIIDCYTFSLTVNNFSTYVIGKDKIAPIVSINKIKNYEIGEHITMSGKIDDNDARLIININGQDFKVPQANIKNSEWFFEINSSDFGIGNHNVGIVAFDFGNNKSAEVTESFNIKKLTPKPDVAIINILTQPASVATDISNTILGDKIKGDAKSTATVLKTNSEISLDKQELRLIIIVISLGITILIVDRKRK